MEAIKEVDGVMFICADHGNAEHVGRLYNRKIRLQRILPNPVPFILVNYDSAYTLREGGCLADIIPTMIQIMGMKQQKK